MHILAWSVVTLLPYYQSQTLTKLLYYITSHKHLLSYYNTVIKQFLVNFHVHVHVLSYYKMVITTRATCRMSKYTGRVLGSLF